MERIFQTGKYDFDKILIDHNTEETIKKTLDWGERGPGFLSIQLLNYLLNV
ncbi:MAG: hypothetical protein P0116_10175 [Candidatus Nitrosocosmicus sp.]|nr:hypothetical protein [Candidatus Nitrosocosmicus sp.]